ncbi:MAG: hypothetical protein R2788_19495 [Saprospiraceae bacterium]
MSILTRKEFEELANKSGSRCISIFLPTHRRGQEVNEHQDEILFKKLLANVEHEMEERKYGKKEIEEFLDPVKALLKDHLFWHYQSESLAVFIDRTFMKYYHLPLSLKPSYYFSHEFYVKPLLPLFMGDGHFYLLALNFHEVKFFQGNGKTGRNLCEDLVFPANERKWSGSIIVRNFQYAFWRRKLLPSQVFSTVKATGKG